MEEKHMKTQTTNDVQIENEVKKDKVKGLINQFGGMLLAFSAFSGVVGFQMEWLNEEVVNSFTVLLYAVAGFSYTAYTIYKNWYSGKKAQKQNKKLKEAELK
ncbi:hypothetical protein [Salinicoccus halitifaciens]|uniref:Uncharacterized membrane protein YebE (DUF533 family) n=1 Tax=Salinicoccus halitifaciens TaxID=1073415 RepID=A0ABV2E642_9STAP|nr:hypothetical protein [Salinicoccus halitifaciens]MCD2137160.1 hypothetical protein [Salinicoccus halitifaciens]